MESRNFRELLEARWAEGKFVCVGLDSDLEKIPDCFHVSHPNFPTQVDVRRNIQKTIVDFNRWIIDQTHDLVGAYKPNSAFYERWGSEGMQALEETIAYSLNKAPGVPVILDAKRADIGNTNKYYAAFAFDYLQADAITVHPYLGREAMQPFLDRADKGIFVLCRTSNPGAGEFQDRLVSGEPLYKYVARQVACEWNGNKNCGLVVGATYPTELAEVRAIVGDMPLLIPGIGTQGGDIEATVKAGRDSRGMGMVINSSSGILFPSSGNPREKVQELHNSITQFLKGDVT